MAPTPTTTEEPEPDIDGERQPPGGRWLTIILLLFAGLFVGWAALSYLEMDSNRYAVALVALRQYTAPVGALLVLVGLLARRWLTTLVVGLVTAVLCVSIVPRAIPDSPATVHGQRLRVLTVNLHLGEADAARVVRLVRQQRVDVLSVQELTPGARQRLDRAGLRESLPFRVFRPENAGAGTGIASRYPLRPRQLVSSATRLRQPGAAIRLPQREIEFVAVHPIYPMGTDSASGDTASDWSRELGSLPDPATDKSTSDTPRVLAGDFNATLDHTAMRELLGKGYQDAAEKIGAGLVSTWPSADGPTVPPVTIDHVLLSGGIVAREYRVFDVRNTDHRAVLAELTVPK